jgi:ferrochelatase
VLVRYGMRYGNPSIASQLDALKADGATPCADAAGLPAVQRHHHGQRHRRRRPAGPAACAIVPELRFVNRYHDDARLHRRAGPDGVREHWQPQGRAETTRHELSTACPSARLKLGDPYHCECLKTGRLLADRAEPEAADA